MIRILTDDKHTEKTIAALIRKMYGTAELDLTFCTPEHLPLDSSGPKVILCDPMESTFLSDSSGADTYFLSLPIRFSAFAELVGEILRYPVAKETATESFSFDESSGTLSKGSVSVTLTPKESELFAYLLKRQGKAVSREELRRTLWSDTDSTNAPDVYVSYLRRKLRQVFGDGILVNERNVGYILKNIF